MCQYNIPLGKKNAIQWYHPLKKWWYSILFSFLEKKMQKRRVLEWQPLCTQGNTKEDKHQSAH